MKKTLKVTRFVYSSILLTWFLAQGANAQNLTISSSGQTGTSGTNWSLSNVSIGQTFGNSTLSNGATCLTSGPLWFTPTTSGFITQIELSAWGSGEIASLVIKSDRPNNCGGTPVVLGTSNTITAVDGWNTWTFATPVPVTANTTYYITSDNATACLGVRWAQSGDDPTTGNVQNGFPFGCTLSNTDPATRIFVSPTAAVQQYANLSVTGTASIHASVLETALANRDLNVVGNTNNFQVSVDQSISVNAGTGNLTFGSSTTTGSFTLNNPITLSGALSVYGGDITVNGNINTTAGNANGDILFKASGDIVQSASKTITTNGGDVIFWANSDGETTNGSVLLRNQSSITTNGGHVWMGGGSGSTTWNGLTVGNGLAVSGTTYSTPVSPTTYESGIYLEKATIQSGGGNVYLAGSSAGTDGSYDFGILTHDVSSINSGLGTITIKGGTGSSTVRGMVVGIQYSNQPGSLTLTSASTQATAIDVDIRSASNFGLAFEGEFNLISTQSGGINFTTIGSTAGTRIGFSNNPGALNVLAASGPIVVNTGASGFDKGSNTSTTQKAFFGAKAGTSVTSSSSNIQFISDDLDELDELNFATTGTLTVEPSGTSFATALNSSSLIQTGLSGLTLGKAGNTAGLTIGSATSVAGPITLLGGDISITGAISTVSGGVNGDVIAKGTGSLVVTADITTSGGDITLWSDSDANGAGGIRINDNVDLDSRTQSDRTANTNTTGGGKITLAGGLDDGGTASGVATLLSGLISSDGYPDGYAVNSGSAAAQSGIVLGTSSTATGHNSNININSGGGDIRLHGLATTRPAGGDPTGLLFFHGYTINAGDNGNVVLLGNAAVTSGSGAIGMDLAAWREANYTASGTVLTKNGNISVVGRGSGGTSSNLGMAIDGTGVKRNIFAATGTGTIRLNGLASGTGAVDMRLTNLDVLAASGTISLITEGSSGIAIGGYNIGDGLFLGRKASSLVTSSSSNVLIQANRLSTTNKPIDFATSGTVTIESFGSAFGAAQAISNVTFGTTISSLTLGKTTNTANLTLGSAATLAGPVTAYGGDIALNESITTSTNSGHILIKAAGNIRMLGEKTLSTQGANVVLWSNSDGGTTLGDIVLQSNFSGATGARIQTNGGHIWLGGGSGTTTWNGITVGNGYAVSGSAISFLNDPSSGSLPSGVLFQGAKLLSGGGNIYVGGQSQQSNSRAVVTTGPVEINSGSGTIEIQAIATSTAGALGTGWNHVSSVPAMNGNFSITSANATSSAILLNADATASNVVGGDFQDEGSGLAGVVSLRTTNGGGLVYNSLGSSARAAAYGLRLGYLNSQGGTLELLSNSGNITLNTGNRRIFLSNNLTNTTLGFKATTPITASTSEVKLVTNDLSASGALNFNTSGQLIIEPFGSSFTSTVNTAQLLYSTGITGLTIGKLGNTSGITIGSATTVTGPVTLFGGALAINGALTATNNTINLNATGAVTQTAALTASNLALAGSGTFTLNNAGNNVATLAAGDNTTAVGNISFTDASGGLTIGTVGNKSGILSSGTVSVETLAGDLTLAQNVGTTNNSASAVTLNAGKGAAIGTTTGGDILVTGSPTLTTGTGGIAKLFSGSDGASTGLISLVGGAVNARLGVDETTTSFSPALGAGGSYALFRALSNAPIFTNLSGDAVSYVLENNPVALDANSNAQVTDSDSPDFNGGALTVSFASNTGIPAEDRLGISNQGTGAGQIGISGSNVLFQGVNLGTFTGGTTGANLVITLNATATSTSVAALLRALNYSNSNTTLSIGSGNRQVAITLTDGDGGISATATVTVGIITSRALSVLSGNNQTASVNQALPSGPVFRVMGSNGVPAANATLSVTANAGQIRLPVLSNLSDTYTTGGSLIDNINWKAHQFTTGNTAVILDQVALLLNKVAAASYPSTVQVEAAIYTVNNFGVPGIEIGTSGIQSALLPAATTWKTMVFTSPIELSPNTNYALVVKGSNSTGFVWGNVRSGSTGPTGWAAFVSSKTTDGSITNWVDGAVRNAFILTGSTPLSATQTLLTNSDGTAALGSWILGDRAGTQELVVSNGTLQGSPLTITATATAVVPSAPTNLSYSPGNGQVTLAFTPGFDGGLTLTNYEYSLDNGSSWTALNPADISSPVTIPGLTNGVTYPVKIRAVNAVGQGAASAVISVNSVISLTNQSITVDPIANQTYTGSALTPAVVVKDGSTTLTPTTDYTVTYTNNTNVGTATVTITGEGNYSGTKTQTFTIVAKAASTLTIDAIANQTYTGSALTPAVVVKDGNTTLTATTDYTVAYTNNTNVGLATVTITGVGNYSGTKTQTFTIVAKAASTLTIDAIANQTYTGSALTPVVVVKDGNTTLTATTDYTVAYTNNTNVGTATVTITGAGNYTGTKTQTFTIVAKAASSLTIDAIANQTYTGAALTPVVVVKDGSTTLTPTTDYTVTYTNNTNVGTATVTITGAGNYTGTKTQTFTIVAKAASSLTIDAIANQTYTGAALTPAVVVKDGNTTLTATTDYTVTYTNNTNVGTATVTITGVGNYSGTKTQTFTIVAKAASSLTIDAIANQTYTGSALTPAVVVKDGNTTLTATTDYTVAYTNNTNVGTATVTITGVGSYSGTKSQTFVIQPKALTIRAVNATKIYGDANPSLGFTYSGLVDGDTEIDQVPSISTTATTTSGVGTYRIILTEGSDPNYTLTRVEGVLEVTPASLSLTVNGATKIYGQADPVYTYNIQGLKGADTEAVLRGTLSREAGEEPGTYRIGAGTLSAGANYSLSVTGANLQIVKARALAVAELGLITTEWSKEAALPATVNVLTTHGQYFRVDVKWDKTTLNLLARGTYALTGTLMLPSGIENPDQVLAKAQVRVLPKAAPLDLTLNNSSFVGSASTYFIPVGAFVVNDPVDKVHVVSLNGPGYDNTYFEIKDNILFWSSADLAAGKTKFSIIVRVTDRDGNTLDKFFEITRTRPSVSEMIIYNSFTPNGDGFNDTWGILDLQFYEGARISIYERGGSRVFYTEKPTIRWDGTFEGKKLPVGTYFWIVEVKETGEVRKGMLNVMRK